MKKLDNIIFVIIIKNIKFKKLILLYYRRGFYWIRNLGNNLNLKKI